MGEVRRALLIIGLLMLPAAASAEPITWREAYRLVRAAQAINPDKAGRLAATLTEIGADEPPPPSPEIVDPQRVEPSLLSLPLETLILKLEPTRRSVYSDRYLMIRARDTDQQLGSANQEQLLFALRGEVLVALSGGRGPTACVVDDASPPGFVTIDTRPPSEIFWNGRRLGATPLARYKLPSGCVNLEAVSGDRRRGVSVMVEPNRVRIYQFPLESAPGS